jgi:hypothetical protein
MKVLDAAGNVVSGASNNVTFEVVAGPGRILSTHNGDPASQVFWSSVWHPAYHGLVRAFVQVTQLSSLLPQQRARMLQIDVDGGRREKTLSFLSRSFSLHDSLVAKLPWDTTTNSTVCNFLILSLSLFLCRLCV